MTVLLFDKWNLIARQSEYENLRVTPGYVKVLMTNLTVPIVFFVHHEESVTVKLIAIRTDTHEHSHKDDIN